MYNEELGIVLKLSEYLIKKQIQEIYLKKYKSFEPILQDICGNLYFSDSGLHINIKNNEKNGIIINYVDNIDIIHAKRIYLIPWSNIENPLIMYKYNKKYIVKKKKINRKFHYLSYDIYNRSYAMKIQNTYSASLQLLPIQQGPILYEQVDTSSTTNNIQNMYIKQLIKALTKKIHLLNSLFN
jgi:hypothetical protein